ncbi:Capsule biosynthesis protein [Sphingomonas antarctica]|uniref:DUF6356 family protein n=1 Tax=Sphingomonas antarctica TaxID=2040274 RepID=UPI0039EBAD1E
MIDATFLKHPRSVGEGYWEHFRVAGSFGTAMVGGGIKAMIHAILPNAYETAGSDTIKRLHTIMVEKRGATRDATMQMLECEWII